MLRRLSLRDFVIVTELEVEFAPNVKIRVVKNTVAQVLSKTEPAEA